MGGGKVQWDFSPGAAIVGFMYGVKRSIHGHCVVLLSQVLLSQVGSLFFFVLFLVYDVTGDCFKLNMSLR